jgi:hypothetical protein
MVDTEEPGTGTGTGRLDIPGMLSQLQGMIGKVAHASEPALREVGAKAAELAAVAADRAGPIAHQLADKTDEVSQVVAERASGFASSLRAAAGSSGSASSSGSAAGSGSETSGTAEPITDPAEESPRDGA